RKTRKEPQLSFVELGPSGTNLHFLTPESQSTRRSAEIPDRRAANPSSYRARTTVCFHCLIVWRAAATGALHRARLPERRPTPASKLRRDPCRRSGALPRSIAPALRR